MISFSLTKWTSTSNSSTVVGKVVDDLWYTAIHEAAHAIVALMLTGDVGTVSIDGDRSSGIAGFVDLELNPKFISDGLKSLSVETLHEWSRSWIWRYFSRPGATLVNASSTSSSLRVRIWSEAHFPQSSSNGDRCRRTEFANPSLHASEADETPAGHLGLRPGHGARC